MRSAANKLDAMTIARTASRSARQPKDNEHTPGNRLLASARLRAPVAWLPPNELASSQPN